MKGCFGWAIAIVAWFIIWGSCMSLGEKWNMSPFVLLLIGVAILLIIAVIVIRINVKLDERKYTHKQLLLDKIDVIAHTYTFAWNAYVKEHKLKRPYSDEVVASILSIPKEYWVEENLKLEAANKKKEKIRQQYYAISNKYPEALKVWKDKNPNTFIADAVSRSNEIERIDFLMRQYSAYCDWENRQREFNIDCIEVVSELFPQLGRSSYQYDIKKIDCHETHIASDFTVWNFFFDAYCAAAGLDYTTRKHEQDNLNLIKSIKKEGLKQIPNLWQYRLYSLIHTIVCLSMDDNFGINVILNDRNVKREVLSKNLELTLSEIKGNYESGKTINVLYTSEIQSFINKGGLMFDNSIIIDLITEVSDIDLDISAITSLAPDVLSTVILVSFYKEYTKSEMAKLIDSDLNKIEQKKAELEARIRAIEIFDSVPKQWEHLSCGLPFKYLFYYFPVSCDTESKQIWHNRNIVWDFKNDPDKIEPEDNEEAIKFVVSGIKDTLSKEFGFDNLRFLTFVCIPASTKIKNENRYKQFSSILSEEFGCDNSLDKIEILEDKETKHGGGSGLDMDKLSFDIDFFKDRFVILFDDIITTGESMKVMSSKLKSLGAHVIGCLSIGKTKHIESSDTKTSPIN